MKSFFISSTFKDMQFERDLFQLEILPEIRRFLRQYGENVNFTDLRWGVDTSNLDSNEGSRKVLSVCLDEIDKAQPYFIVLLGERYGWIPDEALIEDAVNQKQLDFEDLNKSVTALEIEYGALKNAENPHCLFYFREPINFNNLDSEEIAAYKAEDDYHKQKLDLLKEEINKTFPDRVHHYSVNWDNEKKQIVDYEDFVNQVTNDIKQLLIEELGDIKEQDWQQSEIKEDWLFVEEKKDLFAARENLLIELVKNIKNQKLLFIQGVPGVGKSTLVATLAYHLNKSNVTTLVSICGNTNMSTNAINIIQQQVYMLENLLEKPHFKDQTSTLELTVDEMDNSSNEVSLESNNSLEKWKSRWRDLLFEYRNKSKETICIIIDAVDQLGKDDIRDNLEFLPNSLPEDTYVIVSATPDFPVPKIWPYQNDGKLFKLEKLTLEEARKIIKSTLERESKELDNSIIESLMQKKEITNPLYLNIILQQLILMNNEDFTAIRKSGDDIKAINKHLSEIIENSSDEVENLIVEFFNRMGTRINEEQTEKIFKLLALSRYGLREQDLEGIFKLNGWEWNSLDFARLQKYLSSFLRERDDGRADFTHKVIRSSYLDVISEEEKKDLNYKIYEWLDQLSQDDPIKEHEFYLLAKKFDKKQEILDFINELTENKNEVGLNILSQEIRDDSLLDEEGFNTIIGSLNDLTNIKLFYDFFNYYVLPKYNLTFDQLEVLEKLLQSILSSLDNLKGETSLEYYNNYLNFYRKSGEVQLSLGVIQEALKYYQKALKIAKKINQQWPISYTQDEVAQCYEDIAKIYQILNQRTDSLSNFTKSLKLKKGTKSENSEIFFLSKLADSLDNAANLNLEKKNNKKAFELFKESFEIRKDNYMKNPSSLTKSDLARSYYNFSILNLKLKDVNLAKTNIEQAIELDQALLDEFSNINYYQNLSRDYKQYIKVLNILNESEDLQEILKKSLEYDKLLNDYLSTPQTKLDLAKSYNLIGDYYYSNHKDQPALNFYEKALELNQGVLEELPTAGVRKEINDGIKQIKNIEARSNVVRNTKTSLKTTLPFKNWYDRLLKDIDRRKSINIIIVSTIILLFSFIALTIINWNSYYSTSNTRIELANYISKGLYINFWTFMQFLLFIIVIATFVILINYIIDSTDYVWAKATKIALSILAFLNIENFDLVTFDFLNEHYSRYTTYSIGETIFILVTPILLTAIVFYMLFLCLTLSSNLNYILYKNRIRTKTNKDEILPKVSDTVIQLVLYGTVVIAIVAINSSIQSWVYIFEGLADSQYVQGLYNGTFDSYHGWLYPIFEWLSQYIGWYG